MAGKWEVPTSLKTRLSRDGRRFHAPRYGTRTVTSTNYGEAVYRGGHGREGTVLMRQMALKTGKVASGAISTRKI